MYRKMQGAIASLGLYEVIAFSSGFALMAYELVAARILAPTIGSSIYVWTSVIGVMIAALAVGYWAGGWLADKRVAKQDIAWLLLASTVAVIATLIMYPTVLDWVAMIFVDVRAQSVVATCILFLPASFLLGMIAPYLVRLRVKSLATTGRSVASLSALNSIGGILGTFFTGFVFFSWIGSQETLVLLAIILLVSSWLVMPRHKIVLRGALTIGVALVIVLQIASPAQAGVVAHIDTPTSHYTVRDVIYYDRPTRVLATGPNAFQSGVYLDDPSELAFEYTRKMADAVEAAAQKDRILVLGGGVFTLPEYLANKYPASQVDVVEIDPYLYDIAVEYFNFKQPKNVTVYNQDARVFLTQVQQTYDVILVDVYNDNSIPFSLVTREYTQQLEKALTSDGIVVANIIAGAGAACMPLLASVDESYRSVFAFSKIYQVADINLEFRQNLLGIYTNKFTQKVYDMPLPVKVNSSEARSLTDNFAPLEPLWQRCSYTF